MSRHTRIRVAFLHRLLEARCPGQGKDDDFFAGHGTDVVMHAQHLHACGFVDQRFQHRTCQLKQLFSCLLDEISAFLRQHRRSQLPFGESEDAANPDQEEVFHEMDVNQLGSPSQIFLLKPYDPVTEDSFAFGLSQGFRDAITPDSSSFVNRQTSRVIVKSCG